MNDLSVQLTMEAVTPHPPPTGELDPLFGSLPKESIFALIEEFERESKEAIPGPVSRLVETSVALEREYRDWQESKRLRLEYPPPVGEFSLSQVRLFLSPRFKLVSSIHQDAVRAILKAYEPVIAGTLEFPALIPPHPPIDTGINDLDWLHHPHIVLLCQTANVWSIKAIVHQYPDSDWYEIIHSPWDKNRNYSKISIKGIGDFSEIMEGGGLSLPDAVLVYGKMTLEERSVTPMFWGINESYAHFMSQKIKPAPSADMLDSANYLVMISTVMSYPVRDNLVHLSILFTVLISSPGERKRHDIVLTYKMSRKNKTYSIRFLFQQIYEAVITRRPTESYVTEVTWNQTAQNEAIDIKYYHKVYLSMAIITRGGLHELYQSAEPMSRDSLLDTSNFRIDQHQTIHKLTGEYHFDWLQDPLAVFNHNTEWGKAWKYGGNIYSSVPKKATREGGLLIMPLPWFVVLREYLPYHMGIVVQEFTLDSTVFMYYDENVSIYRIQGRITDYQPSDCVYLRPDENIKILEDFAMIQRRNIRTRAEAQIVSL